MTTPSTSDLSALREVAEKATPGPWIHANEHGDDVIRTASGDALMYDTQYYSWFSLSGDDWVYIAAFNPQTVLALLDYLATEKARADAAEAERDALKAEKWRAQHVDTINDMASLRVLYDTAEATISTLTAERDALKRERDEAREALKPFAKWKVAEGLPNGMLRTPDQHPILIGTEHIVYAGDFRRARATLDRIKQEGGERE